MRPEEDAGRIRPTSTLALIGKACPNCNSDLNFLENPPVIVPDDLGELDWDYVKNLSLVPKVLAICIRCGFVAVECLTPVEAKGTYIGT
ncbi:MAG: hypothetical protein ACLQEQ_00795 [Nitrososphaerales archaeon]